MTSGAGMRVWDIQTGIAIRDIRSGHAGNIMFSGYQGMITLVGGQSFFTYELNSGKFHEGQLPLPEDCWLGAQWAHKGSLWFATSFKTDGKLAVHIQELQSTSDPPCHVVKSFPVPLSDGVFSFSPISFHAAFVTQREVVVLDVQDSKILLCTKAIQPLYDPPGQFSQNGCFLACKTLDHSICIWKNISTGYVSWNTVQPRLPFFNFSFSPTATSILTQGPVGIQLLHQENSAGSPSPDGSRSPYQSRKHLVACSASGAYIVTAQQMGGILTVLDPLLGTLVQSIPTSVEIQAIWIVDDTIFVAGGDRLISWNLGVGEGATISGNYDIGTHMNRPCGLVLSNDHSWSAFAVGKTVIIYDITAQEILAKHVVIGITDIQFSHDGHWLYICSCHPHPSSDLPAIHLTKFEMEDRRSVSVTRVHLEYRESQNRFVPPSHGNCVTRSKWVVDSSGCKYFWLPPNWRTRVNSDVQLEGRYLALVGRHHQKPIIIELQQQPHFLPTHP